jgi:hypothetical protein
VEREVSGSAQPRRDDGGCWSEIGQNPDGFSKISVPGFHDRIYYPTLSITVLSAPPIERTGFTRLRDYRIIKILRSKPQNPGRPAKAKIQVRHISTTRIYFRISYKNLNLGGAAINSLGSARDFQHMPICDEYIKLTLGNGIQRTLLPAPDNSELGTLKTCGFWGPSSFGFEDLLIRCHE